MSDSAQDIDRISAALAATGLAADERAAIDLAGLDAAVSDALRAAEAAPASEHGMLRAALERLLHELDRLAARIARQHRAEDQARAAAAYGEAAQRSGGER